MEDTSYSYVPHDNWLDHYLKKLKNHGIDVGDLEQNLQNDLLRQIGSFLVPERYFKVTIDEGGEPPTPYELINVLQKIDQEVRWAWALAQTQKYIELNPDVLKKDVRKSKKLPREEQLPRAFIKWLSDFDVRNPNLKGIPLLVGLPDSWPQEYYPLPVTRIIETRHTNPLEILIVVIAASTVMTFAGCMWSINQWKKQNMREKRIEKEIELLDLFKKIISEGDPEKIKSVSTVLKGLFARNEKTSLTVEALKGKFSLSEESLTRNP